MSAVDELLIKHREFRAGLKQRAMNDLASEMGFRVKPINGETFLVYENAPAQEIIPGLPGEAALDLYRKLVHYRIILNNLVDGRLSVEGISAQLRQNW